MRGARRGQATLELAVAAPLLVILLALPLAAFRWIEGRLAVLDAARQAAWDATVAAGRPVPAPPDVRVRLSRGPDGAVRAEATRAGPTVGLGLDDVRAGIAGLPATLSATVHLQVLPPDAGTEGVAGVAIRRRWLGGLPGVAAGPLLRALLGEDPVRIDFDARPEGTRR